VLDHPTPRRAEPGARQLITGELEVLVSGRTNSSFS
jgi:hypothetical protein